MKMQGMIWVEQQWVTVEKQTWSVKFLSETGNICCYSLSLMDILGFSKCSVFLSFSAGIIKVLIYSIECNDILLSRNFPPLLIRGFSWYHKDMKCCGIV